MVRCYFPGLFSNNSVVIRPNLPHLIIIIVAADAVGNGFADFALVDHVLALVVLFGFAFVHVHPFKVALLIGTIPGVPVGAVLSLPDGVRDAGLVQLLDHLKGVNELRNDGKKTFKKNNFSLWHAKFLLNYRLFEDNPLAFDSFGTFFLAAHRAFVSYIFIHFHDSILLLTNVLVYKA